MLVPFLTCSFETCVCLRRKSLERNLLRLLLTAAGIPRRHFIPILNRIANRTVIPHFLLNMLQIGFHALDFFAYILLMFLENGNHLVNISRDIKMCIRDRVWSAALYYYGKNAGCCRKYLRNSRGTAPVCHLHGMVPSGLGRQTG